MKLLRNRHSKLLLLALAGLLAAAVGPSLALASPQAREDSVEKLLAQGDSYYRRGSYNLAIGTYLEAASMSQDPLNQSAASFGLALCYFYQRDNTGALKWIRKTLEVDPNKQISSQFYPKGFLELFNRAKSEAAASSTRPRPQDVEVVEKPVVKTKEEANPPVREEPPPETRRKEPPPTVERRETPPPVPTQTAPAESERGGHWEIGGHYSAWTINPIMSIFNSRIIDKLGGEVQNQINKKISGSHAGLVKAAFTPNLTLDSSGGNFGLEVRYYASGWAGTFSLGASLEQTKVKLSLTGDPLQTFTNGSFAQASAQASLETASLWTTNFNFRWEIGHGRLRPYIVFGFGFGTLDGTFQYSYSGTYHFAGLQESIEPTSASKTFAELSTDIDFNIPTMFVILQFDLGLKFEIVRGFSVLAEAGIWDGLILRAGLAYRF